MESNKIEIRYKSLLKLIFKERGKRNQQLEGDMTKFNNFNVGETKILQASKNQSKNREVQTEDTVKWGKYCQSRTSEETGRDITQSTWRNIHIVKKELEPIEMRLHRDKDKFIG